jgi:soluble lytic murein transglycosylase-like protein
MKRLFSAALLAGLLTGQGFPAFADPAQPAGPSAAGLWGYIDGQGVAHVARQPLDSRYRLILPAAAERGTGRQGQVPGKKHTAGSLLTWLEYAPEVRTQLFWLREAAQEHGVDVELLKALIAVESGFDARAVSPRGALGLMQIMPATGDRYATRDEARRPAQERLLDPRTNIHTGARMLADLTRRLGGIDLALAAWNAGEGRVRRHGGRVPPYEETRAHVHLVLEIYWALLQRSQVSRATQLRLY